MYSTLGVHIKHNPLFYKTASRFLTEPPNIYKTGRLSRRQKKKEIIYLLVF